MVSLRSTHPAVLGTRRANQSSRQKPVQPSREKYFAFAVGQISSTSSPRPFPARGALRGRHERGMGCGGRGSVGAKRSSQGGFPVSDRPARRRTALQRLRQDFGWQHMAGRSVGGGRCVRRSRVVLASVADAKPCGGETGPTGSRSPSIRLATVTKRNSSPRRARRKPLKPLRGESRVISGGTRGDYRVLTTNAHGPRVLRAPGFPCSLFSMRDDVLSNLGQTMPRECDVIPSRLWRSVMANSPLADFCWTPPLMSGSSSRGIVHQTGRQSLGGQNVALCGATSLQNIPC